MTCRLFKGTLCLIISIIASASGYAQKNTDASITGHVKDAVSGEHLPGVTVMLKGTVIGTQTTVSGHYTLRNISLGKQTVVASAIGYAPAVMNACKLELHAAMKNILNAYQNDFDQGTLRDSGYIYGPSLPRSLILGTVLRF